MRTRYLALAFGIVFLLVGIAGFIPPFVSPPPTGPDVAVDTGFGRLMGLFPINALHNLVHIVFGIWGLVAYRSFSSARLYGRGVAVIYGILAVMGLIPGLNTTFGLVPIYGHVVWLHALLAIVAAYFGFFAGSDVEDRTTGAGTASRL